MSEAAAAPQIGDDLGDDIVLPFRTERSGVIGRLVRLGPAIDTILSRHDMPVPVAQTLGEAVALTAMLGAALKFDGKLIVQTKTDGIARFPRRQLRGAAAACAATSRYDKKRFAEARPRGRIDQGDAARHAGISPSPSTRARTWSATRASSRSTARAWRRGAGLLPAIRAAADLPAAGGCAPLPGGRRRPQWHWLARRRPHDPEPGRTGGKPQAQRPEGSDDAELQEDDDEDWERTRILAATVEDHELLDPTLSPRAPALSAVPRGGRARPAAGTRRRPTAAARASTLRRSCARSERWSSPTCASRTAASASRASSARRPIASRRTRSTEVGATSADRLQISDDLAALLRVADAGERLHRVAAHDLVGVGDELVERRLIPGDAGDSASTVEYA